MAVSYPQNPNNGDLFTVSNTTYRYDGTDWTAYDGTHIRIFDVSTSLRETTIDGDLTVTGNITSGQNEIFPAGTIIATIASVASSGWLLLDGSSHTNADTTYPDLWDVVPTSWKSGTTLNLPNMSDRTLEGHTTTTLGALGGSNTVTIAESNLPTHQHSISHGHGDDFSASQDSHDHTANHDHAHTIAANQATHHHSVNPPSTGVSVTVDDNGTDLVRRRDTYESTSYRAIDINFDSTTFGMAVDYISSHGHSASGTVDIASFNSVSTDPAITISGSVSTKNVTTNSATPDITVGGGVTDHTGSSDDGGFANSSITVTNAHLAVNFQIKAH